ncbi:hypothetical protein ACFVGY_33040 [Streptomyces sp. NPDC127106]|uniref:hypothetical protein n=1 Tax=Streptomyces sp. NPDC127106 TaxID=3345360 RepID=UPI00363E8312
MVLLTRLVEVVQEVRAWAPRGPGSPADKTVLAVIHATRAGRDGAHALAEERQRRGVLFKQRLLRGSTAS